MLIRKELMKNRAVKRFSQDRVLLLTIFIKIRRNSRSSSKTAIFLIPCRENSFTPWLYPSSSNRPSIILLSCVNKGTSEKLLNLLFE